jgi:hypothetical protein
MNYQLPKEQRQQIVDALQASIDVPCYGGHPRQEAALDLLKSLPEVNCEPVAWIVFDEEGLPSFTAIHPRMAQDHINDALQEHGITEASKWFVRSVFLAPQPAADVVKDAERYQWLRLHGYVDSMKKYPRTDKTELSMFDDAIDAAMSSAKNIP